MVLHKRREEEHQDCAYRTVDNTGNYIMCNNSMVYVVVHRKEEKDEVGMLSVTLAQDD